MSDHTAVVIAAWAGVTAAAAALGFGVLTYCKQWSDSRKADRRHESLIQPRPAITNVDPEEVTSLVVQRVNPGGAATQWCVVLHHTNVLYLWQVSVPAHDNTTATWHVPWAATVAESRPTSAGTGVVMSYAVDIDENAWDVLAGARTAASRIDHMRRALAPLGCTVDDNGTITGPPTA